LVPQVAEGGFDVESVAAVVERTLTDAKICEIA
jgi:hypothetical protein